MNRFLDLYNNHKVKLNKIIEYNDNNNLSEYSWKKQVNLIEENILPVFPYSFDDINFTYEKNNMEIESDLSKLTHQYFSFFEKDIDFGKLPTSKNAKVSPDYLYKVNFEGIKDDSIQIDLYLIYYSSTTKEQIEVISLNEQKIIKLKDNITQYRIAFRINGQGKVIIKKSEISKCKEVKDLPIKTLRKLGYDKAERLKKLKVAAICDEFTEVCLKHECDLITFEPDNWKAIFEFNKPHILFVESAWHGKNGAWKRKVTYVNETNTLQLNEIVTWCQGEGIPTVFWNKEDPVHFNSFIKTAQKFDYIFTTDANSIENYLMKVNHHNVYSLPFAAQPRIHNPIEKFPREDKPCFAGSYYAENYLERQADMNKLLTAAQNYNLVIYDRNHGKNLKQFYFPEKYHGNIQGKLNAEEIDKAYKGYAVALNVNSVNNSTTMCSRRVFECLASYTPVVSTYSQAIENLLPNIVQMGVESNDYEKIMLSLFEDKQFYDHLAHKGYRYVMENHTFEKRLHYILEKVNLNIPEEFLDIRVFSIVNNIEEYQFVVEQFLRQNYSFKKLILISENKELIKSAKSNIKNISIISTDEFLNEKDTTKYAYSYFSSANYYGENYLKDLTLAQKYVNANVIGKGSFYEWEDEGIILRNEESINTYTSDISMDLALIIQDEKFNISNKDLLISIKEVSLKTLVKYGISFYSTDKFNVVRNYAQSKNNSIDINRICI